MPEDKPAQTPAQIQREIAVRTDRATLTDDQFKQKYDIPDKPTTPPTPGNKGKN